MSQFVCNEKLLDFLLYSYFECDREENEEEVIQKCARRAYRDLARTVKYAHPASELEKAKAGSGLAAFKNIQKKRILDVCEDMAQSIYACKEGFNKFNSWHEKKCNWIIGKMNETYDGGKKFLKKDFTYGQAQKWLNMTLKYLWLLDRLPKGIKARSLHVPIDRFILEKLKETGKFNDTITNSGETFSYNGETWSSMSDIRSYKTLQKEIKKIAREANLLPIEWESLAWLEIAKSRKSR